MKSVKSHFICKTCSRRRWVSGCAQLRSEGRRADNRRFESRKRLGFILDWRIAVNACGFFFFVCFFSQFLWVLSICNSATLAAGRKRSTPRYELSRYISRRLSVKLLMAFCGVARLSRSSQFISQHRLYLSRTLHFVMFH